MTNTFLRATAAAAAVAIYATSAGAAVQTATIDGIIVTDSGRVDPATAPVIPQPMYTLLVGPGPVTLNIGQPGGGNPPAPNQGWDPYGLSDTTHSWINVGNDNTGAFYAFSGSTLTIVWGSPNNDAPGADNVVSFFDGAGGTGNLIGRVEAADLYANFTGISNTQDPGYLISFATPTAFKSVEFSTGPSAFEFAAVPEASTWAMLALGFAGLGFAGHRSRRAAISIA
jgi:hypothetical protein